MKNNKGYKIKRYNNIYRKKFFNIRFSPLKIASLIVGCALLLFVGVSISNVVYERLNNPKSKEEIFNNENKSNDSENIPNYDNGKEEVKYSVAKNLDLDTASNIELLDKFINDLKLQNIKDVMIMLKDDTGKLYYNSKSPYAILSNAIYVQVDISVIAKKLHDNGMTLTAVLSAFKDQIVSDKVASTSVMYKTGSYKWLDKALVNNGKTWLDPSSNVSQEYIKYLIDEVYDLGVDRVIINDFNYPINVPGIDSAVFVKGNNSTEKQEVLRTFANILQTDASTKNKEIYFNFSLDNIIDGDVYRYGGSIKNLGIKNFYLNLQDDIKTRTVNIDSESAILQNENNYEMKENIIKYFNSLLLDNYLYVFTDKDNIQKLSENFNNIKVFAIY